MQSGNADTTAQWGPAACHGHLLDHHISHKEAMYSGLCRAMLCSTVWFGATLLKVARLSTCQKGSVCGGWNHDMASARYTAASEKNVTTLTLVVQALPLLSSTILLLLIFVFLFGVAGIQLFQDAAHQTCVNIADGSYPDLALTENSDEWGCGHRHCPSNYTCTVGPCQQFCLVSCFQC